MFELKRIVFVAWFTALAGCDPGAGSETQRHTVGDGGTSAADGADSTGSNEDAIAAHDEGAADATVDGSTTEGARNCETAIPLVADIALRDQAIASEGGSDTHCRPSDVATRFYRFDIPARSRATFVVTPNSQPSWSAVVRMTVACGEQECVADESSPTPGAPVEITIDNSDVDPLHKIVSVSPEGHDVVGSFDIVVHVASSLDAGGADASDATDGSSTGGGDCSAPIEVTDGTHLANQDPLTGVTASFACEHTESGRPNEYRVRFYRVTVPSGDYLRVTARPSVGATLLPAMFLLDDCTGSTCPAQLASFRAEQADYTVSTVNRGTSAANFILAVGVYGPDAPHTTGTFDLDVSLDPPAANAACANAMLLDDGARLTHIANSGGRDALAACGRATSGSALYYRVRVPAGARLTARGTRSDPDALGSVTTRLLDGCGDGASCLGSATLVEDPGQLTYRNGTSAAQDLVLAMTGENREAYSDLAVEIWNEPFAVTPIVASCEDMSGAASVMDDASYSARRPMPFAFPFMGESMTWFAVHGTGRIGLFTGDGPADGQYGDMPIPAYAPNLAASIAPFWAFTWPADRTAGGGRSDIVSRTFDGADPHVTFEFRDWSFLDDQTARVTFQARLYVSGAIEFHYCAATGARADLLSGATASAGVQSSDGFRGTEIARRVPGRLAAGTGFRLLPAE